MEPLERTKDSAFMAEKFLKEIENGEVSIDDTDEMRNSILYTIRHQRQMAERNNA